MEDFNIPAEAAQTGGIVHTAGGDRPLPALLDIAWLDSHLGQDFMLCWPVGSLARSRLQYPLRPLPEMDHEDLYYEVQIHVAVDYVYRMSELIAPFEDTRCSCGEELEFDAESGGRGLFYQSRIRSVCSACGQGFDPGTKVAEVADGRTGETRSVCGGATSRLAIVIDCGKAIPDSAGIVASPDLVSLCQRVLGCSVDEIGEYY